MLLKTLLVFAWLYASIDCLKPISSRNVGEGCQYNGVIIDTTGDSWGGQIKGAGDGSILGDTLLSLRRPMVLSMLIVHGLF